jgi:hypothetical protein
MLQLVNLHADCSLHVLENTRVDKQVVVVLSVTGNMRKTRNPVRIKNAELVFFWV